VLTRLIHPRIGTCISAQVQGRDISSERTLKVGISHSSVSRFPLVFFIHDKQKFFPFYLSYSGRTVSCANSLVQVHSGRICIVDARREHSSFKRNKNILFNIPIYECSFNPIVARNPKRAFFSEMYHFHLLDWWILSCYKLRYIQEKNDIS